MKRIIFAIVILASVFGTYQKSEAQAVIPDKQAIIDSLTSIDPNIIKYFPRWKVCEPDLLIQLYQTFLYQFDEALLNQQDIEILAAPKEDPNKPFELLMIKCGEATMNSVTIDAKLSSMLIAFLSGEFVYKGYERGYPPPSGIAKRDYCFTEIPAEVPVSPDQTAAIIDFLQPTNVTHAFTVSLFEQAVKIGESGFWLRNKVGTDEVGYAFWSAGEAKTMLQRPLYINKDPESRKAIPYLINAHLGGGYRITSGINSGGALSWIQDRTLNAGPGGKFIAGFDFHLPMKPEFGIGMNFELPMQSIDKNSIEEENYAYYAPDSDVDFSPNNQDAINGTIVGIAPILRATGQIKAFYHLWLNKDVNPENYFRFELGLSYSEVQEAAVYDVQQGQAGRDAPITYLGTNRIEGLQLYKPNEFGDWVYAKIEYRNQDVFPFGASVQYSNQMLLGNVYIPLFGNWFYLEGKYSKLLRGARPYETDDFYMISPVIRLTL